MIEVTVANHVKDYSFHVSVTLERKLRDEYVVHITREPLKTDKEIVIKRQITGGEMAVYTFHIDDAVFSFVDHGQCLELKGGYIPGKALRVDILGILLN